MGKRILMGFTMAGPFYLAVLYEPAAFLFPLLTIFYGSLILWETVGLVGKRSLRVSYPWCAAISLALVADAYWYGLNHAIHILTGAMLLLMCARILKSDITNIAPDVGGNLFVILYVGLPTAMAVAIMETFDAAGTRLGNWHLIYLVFVVFAGDSGAYFIGRFLGKRPFFPKLSPKKTLEGAIGGVAMSMVFTVIVLQIVPVRNIYGWKHGLILAFLLALVSPLGDLAESAIKRDVKQKDSSNLIAGHGGFLDVFDSFIFGLWVQFAYIQLFLANP